MTWRKSTDGRWYLFDLRLPVDFQAGGMATLLLAPSGTGSMIAVPALETGPPGLSPVIDNTVNNTPLAYEDVTPDSMSFTTLSAPTATSPGVYRLNATQRRGQDGADGDTILDPDDYGTPLAGQMLVVAPGLLTFQYQTQKVGDCYWPATIQSTPAGSAQYTLASVPVPAQPWDWRPTVFGSTIVAGTGPNLRVDLIARLNSELSSGAIVGRCFGMSGQNDRLILQSGPPAGSADNYNRVLAGQDATIYLRVERQLGGDTFTTDTATTSFKVKVDPVP